MHASKLGLLSVCLLSTLAVLTASPDARAQVGDRAASWEQFHPRASQHTSVLNLDRPEVLDHLQVSAGLFTHFVDDPVQLLSPDGERVESRLVDDQLKTEIAASIGLFDVLQLNVVAPIVPYQRGTGLSAVGGDTDADGLYVSEIRSSVDAPILRPSDNGGFGLGVSGRVYIPSGATASFNSDRAVHGGPFVNAIWQTRSNFQLIGNLGFDLRQRNQLRNYLTGHSFHWGVGGVVPFADDRLAFMGNVFGRATVVEPNANVESTQYGTPKDPAEVLAGLRWDLSEQLRLQGGGGTGISAGVGSPDFRLFASLHFRTASKTEEPAPDPEPAAEPDEPEEPAPAPEPEPEPDPEPSDRDGDGIVDSEDACPDEKEVFNGVDDEDGCPDEEEALVKLVRLQIRFAQKIHFDTDKAEVREEDNRVLDEVVALLEEYPELTKIRVEGHADSRASEDYNQKLSERRSESIVQYLVDEGIDRDRLEPVGRGEREPSGDNRTAEGRWQNRRVDFVITEVEGESVEDQESIELERLVD